MPPRPAPSAEEYFDGEAGEEDPRLRIKPSSSRRLPWLRMSLISAAAVGALTYLAERHSGWDGAEPGPVPAAILTAPPPSWEPILPAVAWYGLEPADDSKIPALEARRRSDGAREDLMLFGAIGEAGHLRLVVGRNTGGQSGSFFVELVRHAAQAGLSVTRSAQAHVVETKFGEAQAADVVFSGPAEQACLAFRLSHPAEDFSIRGWLCGTAERPSSDRQLACAIDRLSLAKAVSDPALKTLFAAADRRRGEGCAPVARLERSRRG